MKVQSLDNLFLYELQQLHLAERAFLAALPNLATKGGKLAVEPIMEALERIQRLEQIFRMLDHTPTASACWAMRGILTDGGFLLGLAENRDAQDLAKAAAIETGRRYLVTRYTLLVSLANRLGKTTVEKLLRVTLDAEIRLDKGEANASTVDGLPLGNSLGR
jgi:ferritin-like metal-binding protein YciE